MKLLLDQNLSAALIGLLADLFPNSVHVRSVGLSESSDDDLWAYALKEGFTIVSKDSDFQQRSLLFGHPPKVVWLRVGNCTTSQIELLLRMHSATLHTFEADRLQSILALS